MNKLDLFLEAFKGKEPQEILGESITDYLSARNISELKDKSLEELVVLFNNLEYKEFAYDSQYFLDNIVDIKKNAEKYRWVYNELLHDNYSREVFLNMLRAKTTMRIEYIADAYQYLPTQYFNKEWFDFGQGEVFVDCGAYNGDTIEDFIKACPNYKKIYAYEAMPTVIEEAQKRLAVFNTDNSIVYKQFAVSDCNETLHFSAGMLEGDSFVDENGDVEVHTITLDEDLKDEKVSFIKMDIEGCEMQALKGAQNLIKKNIPKMAICIYHQPGDFWKIPEYIFSLSSNYRFMVRQYRKYQFYDTILYCIPDADINNQQENVLDDGILLKRMNAILERSVVIPPEDKFMSENIEDAKIWLLKGIAREQAAKGQMEKDYNNLYQVYTECKVENSGLNELKAELRKRNQELYEQLNSYDEIFANVCQKMNDFLDTI